MKKINDKLKNHFYSVCNSYGKRIMKKYYKSILLNIANRRIHFKGILNAILNELNKYEED